MSDVLKHGISRYKLYSLRDKGIIEQISRGVYPAGWSSSCQRTPHDLGHWIKFFLTAVQETATNGKETFQSILQLRQTIEARIVTLGRRAENARKLLLNLYQQPIISIKQVAELLDITPRAVTALVMEFVKMDILVEQTGYTRNREFVFEPYLSLF